MCKDKQKQQVYWIIPTYFEVLHKERFFGQQNNEKHKDRQKENLNYPLYRQKIKIMYVVRKINGKI